MMDAVHRYEGYVAQALGDGIFALFGASIAHEDHSQRALCAALRMQEEMRAYSDQTRLKHGVPLQMRIGINTGEVVVRSIRKDDLHTDYVPVDHSTNLAARMEQLANPGSRGSCCSSSPRSSNLKLKRVFSKPSPWPVSSTPNPGNCVPPPASPGCGSHRTRRPKPAPCSPRSMTGSLKALTRKICKRRKRCWKS